MTRSELRLRPVRLADEAHVRAAQAALAADDFEFALGLHPDSPWPAFVESLDSLRRAVDVPASWVPATFLLAVVGDDVVGRTSIRHRLNDHLRLVGGHIGYAVLPGFRRQGHATEILRQSLVIARSCGVDRVLLTCADDNAASARVITRCGGILENVVVDPASGRRMQRYWID